MKTSDDAKDLAEEILVMLPEFSCTLCPKLAKCDEDDTGTCKVLKKLRKKIAKAAQYAINKAYEDGLYDSMEVDPLDDGEDM